MIDSVLQGIPISPGVAVGQAYFQIESCLENKTGDPAVEIDRFLRVLQDLTVGAGLSAEAHRAKEDPYLDTYRAILESPNLKTKTIEYINLGYSAETALKKVIEHYSKAFDTIADDYLKARLADITDVIQHIIAQLQKSPPQNPYPENLILILKTVSIINVLKIPREYLKGIICSEGSIYSHMAILARELGIPVVFGIHLNAELDSKTILVDGTKGRVYLNPSDRAHQSLYVPKFERTRTKGISLYRSEIAFMTQDNFPSEALQYTWYRDLLESVHPHPVNIRLLDLGGDKLLPYFKIDYKKRGLSLLLDYPEIFETQLGAMLKANEGLNNLRILLPMVSKIDDLEKVLSYKGLPKVGAMIEEKLPQVVLEAIIERVDFLSVGSNDLIHSILGIERGGVIENDLHPEVLDYLEVIVKAAHNQHKKVSICGEMATNPKAAIFLKRLGFLT